jgi:hypothetical protein
MRHNAIVMQSIMLVGILAPLWWAWTIRAMPAARAAAVAASIMNIATVLVTRFGNVPINQLVRKWLTEAPPANYLEPLHRWDVFNDIRSIAAVFGFLLILIADALMDQVSCQPRVSGIWPSKRRWARYILMRPETRKDVLTP